MATNFNYGKIRMKRTDRLNEIIKSTKNMIINSSKFNTYLNEYVTAVQVPTFKRPEINSYPILKNHFLIPLNKMHSIEEDKVIRPFSSIQRIQNSTTDKSSFPGLLRVGEFNKKNSISINNNSNGNELSKAESKKRMKMRVNSASNIYVNNRQPNLKRDNSNFQRGCLINAFFSDWYFNDLIYDESQIFNKEVHYNKFIDNKMTSILRDRIENTTSVYTNTFNQGSPREMTITLSSMRIEFRKETRDKKNTSVIYLPFAYLFLFYYRGIEYFQRILLAIIKFNEDNDKIELDEQLLIDVLRTNQSLFQIKKEKNIETMLNKQKKSNNRLMLNHIGEIEAHDYPSSSSQIHPNNKTPQSLSTLSQSAYNNYYYIWIAPKDIYQIRISLPEISILVKKTHTKVFRYIDREFILFMLGNDFVNWDFYVINFLFSLKDFRVFIEGMLSKSSDNKSKSFNKGININSNFSNTKPNNKLNLSPIKAHNFSLHDYTFSYFYSNKKDQNSLHVLHSYSVIVFFANLKPLKKFKFDFTFKQMIILNKILIQTGNLETFIMKILKTESMVGEIQLDYSFFEYFDENIFKDKENYDTNDKSNKTNIKGIEIIISQPYLERIYPESPYRSNEEISNPLSKDIITQLEGKELNLWPKILMNYSVLVDTPIECVDQISNIRANTKGSSKFNLMSPKSEISAIELKLPEKTKSSRIPNPKTQKTYSNSNSLSKKFAQSKKKKNY